MSQNTLVQKIEADAQAAVAEVQAKQTAAIETIEKDTKEKVAVLEAAHAKQLEKKLAHHELVALSRAKQAANIAVQSAKREAIDDVFNIVHVELSEMNSEQYVSFFSAQVAKAVPADVKITAIHAPETRAVETKSILEAAKLSGDVTATKTIVAGLIIYAEDGVYDITLKRLFADNQAAMEMDIVKALTS